MIFATSMVGELVEPQARHFDKLSDRLISDPHSSLRQALSHFDRLSDLLISVPY